MTVIKYIFNDSQSRSPFEQEQRQYWYEKLHIYRNELLRQRNWAQYEGDIELLKRLDAILKQVDQLLDKCHEKTVICVTVQAEEVSLFDMQQAVALIQSETGLSGAD